jgi:hypothetical protein
LSRPSGHLRGPVIKMSGSSQESIVNWQNPVSNMGLWRNR